MADQPRRALDALTSSDVGRLLAHHSLDRYASSFESLSGADLRDANDTDLEELGVKVAVHRRRLLALLGEYASAGVPELLLAGPPTRRALALDSGMGGSVGAARDVSATKYAIGAQFRQERAPQSPWLRSSPNHSRAWWGDEPPASAPSAETMEEERLQRALKAEAAKEAALREGAAKLADTNRELGERITTHTAERDAMRAQMGLGSSPSYNPLSIRADRPSGAADDGAADASAVSEEKHLELIEAAELLEAALEASTKREAELMRRLELESDARHRAEDMVRAAEARADAAEQRATADADAAAREARLLRQRVKEAQAEALRHAEAHQRAAVSAQADREAAAAALSKAARLEAAAAKKADEENIAAAAEEEKRRQTLASRKEAGKWLKKTKGKKKAEKEDSAEESEAEED